MSVHALWPVPRDWPGATVAVLGAGPSMSAELVAPLRGRCRVIAVNNCGIDSRDSVTGEVVPAPAPWADVLFASDAKWWRQYKDAALKFAGMKISGRTGLKWPDVHELTFSNRAPFDPRPTHIVSGGNSGYQAVCVAAHFGAARILLVGFDLRVIAKRRHYFGNHPPPCHTNAKYDGWIKFFLKLSAALDQRGVTLVNCTPGSALHLGRASTIAQEFPAIAAPIAEVA